MQLNCFVRVVAPVERAGTALCTLAFTWATVVPLGGMFCPNRSEYQLFFRTRGALRPFSWNGVIVVICLNDVGEFLSSTRSKEFYGPFVYILMLVSLLLPPCLSQEFTSSALGVLFSIFVSDDSILSVDNYMWRFTNSSSNRGNANDHDKTNLKPTLNVFYGMVLGQGILYLVARKLEFFSFFPRRSLARLGGFRGQQGVKSVDMYYPHAFEKCMNASILAPKKMNLITFATNSLESGSRKEQLCGVRILYSLVNREPYDKQVLSKVANSTKTVATLIQMLGWTNPEDGQIRLLAAKITAELASGLQIITIPGAMNFVSSLLDNQNKQRIQELTIQKDSCYEENCWILKLWHQMTTQWSILEEEQWTESDILPVLGLVTLERLATYDRVNCVEISRSMDLIPKIIEFTSNSSERMRVNETCQKLLIDLSLKVLRRPTNIGGETGITLRRKISEDPFLLGNLAEILEDSSSSSQELRELTTDILIKLAMDETTKDTSNAECLVTYLTT
uniref:BLE2 protein n=1 Tax=Oryza brachyantha TaxID=4533 RepID=J3MNK9_ORYBR